MATKEQILELQKVKNEIRMQNPELKPSTIEKRAIREVGLDPGISEAQAEKILSNGGGKRKGKASRVDKTISESKTATQAKRAGRAVKQIPKPAMNPTQAQRIIFGIMVGVTALTIFGDILSGKGNQFDVIPRRMIGGTLAGIMLMLLAVPAPRLAVGFAALAGAGALFLSEGGQAVIDALTKITGGGSPATSGVQPSVGKNFPRGGKRPQLIQ